MELFNPMIEGIQYNGFLNALKDMGNNMNIFVFLQNDNDFTFFDDYIRIKLGERFLQNWCSNTLKSTYTSIYGMLMLSAYELNGLYKSTQLEYNPIENYNGSEEETTSYGSQTINSKVGALETNGSNTYAPFETENTEKIATFDSVQNVESMSATQKLKQSYTDTNSYNAGEQNNSQNIGAKEDKRTLTRKGNIGVTTSQQMIESERKVLLFTFADELCRVLQRHLLRMEW